MFSDTLTLKKILLPPYMERISGIRSHHTKNVKRTFKHCSRFSCKAFQGLIKAGILYTNMERVTDNYGKETIQQSSYRPCLFKIFEKESFGILRVLLGFFLNVAQAFDRVWNDGLSWN